jgi:hypothetical protein
VNHDGKIFMAYRLRRPDGRGTEVVIAVSRDGVNFTTLVTLDKDTFHAESLERSALVRLPNGRWRLYLSCATWKTKHWRVVMVEADHPSDFGAGRYQVVLPGDELYYGVKDPVIKLRGGRWHMWATEHPLEELGAEDRMRTAYLTGGDGLAWTRQGIALSGRPGQWDARGARVTAVIEFGDERVMVTYDGRDTAEGNFDELTGVAIGSQPGALTAIGDGPWAQSSDGRAFRYLDLVPLGSGHSRAYFEVDRGDGAHELRTALVLA